MKSVFWSKVLFLTALAGGLWGADIQEEDIQALRDWINTKRLITARELGGQLSVSGDIHAEFQSAREKKNGVSQRGPGLLIPNNHMYDVEFNLMVDYRTDFTWLATRIRFDNDGSLFNDFLGSGSYNKLVVDRAYWGYRLIDRDQHTSDIEVGRREYIAVLFDSRIQFASNFDGVSFKDNYSIEKLGNLYYQLASFLVSEKRSQFAYLGELGVLNLLGTGAYLKYSIIDWDTKKVAEVPNQFDFIVSQATLGYKWIPQRLDRPIHIYSAAIYNHRAERLPISANHKENWGGYLGFSVGALKTAGDWSVDLNYQLLQAQCVPAFDVQGIGFGNSPGNSFYYTRGEDKKVVPNTVTSAQGNVNYQGFQISLQYLITSNLNLFQNWRQSRTLNKEIGPFRTYNQYELDLIYSF